jgi:hypothetical protein
MGKRRSHRGSLRSKLPADVEGNYIISISGARIVGELAGSLGNEGIENLKKATSLQRKGGKSVAPARITMWFEENDVLLFYFPNNLDPVLPEDKEVVFQTKLQTLDLKIKFSPKDMRYQGKMAV